MACTDATSHTLNHYEREREVAFVGILGDGLIFYYFLG